MTGAIGLPDPDNPEAPPLETEGVGEDPGSIPGDEPAIDPVGPDDPEPDVNDGEAPTPMGGDDEQ